MTTAKKPDFIAYAVTGEGKQVYPPAPSGDCRSAYDFGVRALISASMLSSEASAVRRSAVSGAVRARLLKTARRVR